MIPSLEPPFSQEVQDEATSYDLTDKALDVPPIGISQALVESLYYRTTSGDPSVIPELKKLIEKYPNYPVISNYLSNCYRRSGKIRQAREVERENLRINPDYLFARVNVAAKYIEDGKLDDVRKILGENLRLSEIHRVDRKIHIAEWASYYQIVGLYYVDKDELLAAQSIINAFYHYGLHDEQSELLESCIHSARMLKFNERILEDKRTEICVKLPSPVRLAGKIKYYKPQHKILDQIFEYHYDFPKKLLDDILELPRESAVRDLVGMLEAEVHNGPIFMRDGEESACYMTIHLLFILSEMKAKEAIDSALLFFSQHPDVIHYVLGEAVWWQPIYGMISDSLVRVAEWMKTPGLSGDGRNHVSDAVCKIAIYQPERRNEVIAWHADVLTFLRDSPPKNRILDTRLISGMVCSLIKLRAVDLVPLVRSLYEKNYVSVFRCGSLESVIEDMNSDLVSEKHETAPTMIDFYRSLIKYSEPVYPSEPIGLPYADTAQSYLANSYSNKKTVVERNDPCPCGSGKKYKKCCI